MTTDTSPYAAPKSDLSVKQDFIPSFSNLNFWRKLYLVLMWLLTLLVIVSVVRQAFDGQAISGTTAQLAVAGLWLGLSCWQHTAIVNRKLTQLTVLTVINIVPFFNIIGALILLSIRRVTKKELEMYNISST